MLSNIKSFDESLTVWDYHIQRRDFETILNSGELFFLTFCNAFALEKPHLCRVLKGRKVVCYLSKNECEAVQKVVESIRSRFLRSFQQRDSIINVSVIFEGNTLSASEENLIVSETLFKRCIGPSLPGLAHRLMANDLNFQEIQMTVKKEGDARIEAIGHLAFFIWPHTCWLAESLFQMRLKGEGCDFKLISSQGTPFPVHSYVLQSREGSVFERLVTANKHSSQAAFEYSDFVVSVLIDYLYVGKNSLNHLEAKKFNYMDYFELYDFAKEYDLPDVETVAADAIKFYL